MGRDGGCAGVLKRRFPKDDSCYKGQGRGNSIPLSGEREPRQKTQILKRGWGVRRGFDGTGGEKAAAWQKRKGGRHKRGRLAEFHIIWSILGESFSKKTVLVG